MGVAKIACLSQSSLSSSEKQDFSDKKATHQLHFIIGGEDSMSQEYHHHQQPHEQPQASIFNFPNGFDRSAAQTGEDPGDQGLHPVYESAGMLSEMFNFGQGPGPGPNATAPPELLDYRRAVGGLGPEWYGSSNRQVGHEAQRQGVIGDHQHQHEHNDTPTHHQHQMGGGINAHNSAAAMQLFQTNPPQRSPSPPPPQQPPPPNIQASGGSGIHSIGGGGEAVHHQSFWSGPSPHHHNHHHNINNPVEFSNIIEGQGLSLSLSSSLQHLEAAKQAEDHLRNIGAAAGGDSHIMFFNHHQGGGGAGIGPSSSATNATSPGHHFFKNLTTPSPQGHQQSIILHNLQPVVGGFASPNSGSVGFGSVASASSSLGVVNVLRNSKYAKPAQELLEEFCSVGRGQMKKPKLGRQDSSNNQNATTSGAGGGSGDAAGSSSTKDPSQVAPADRIEHQRRKVKLLAMLDEVDRRYNHYCEQMQMVVNSFDLVVGFGAAVPYTALAQKAMSRHFRCLKDAIHSQLKQSCELLGEKDPTASSGLTKGETPRLKVLEQSLRQQRAFHQMGMMDQEAWRPQRGLPERSVNILRAWLFEHFLHPYPSDADKHLLARQTGLSRNQVSNWFINARVRLWKPMVEEMYQQEAKDEDEDENQTSSGTSNTNTNNNFATTQHSQQHQQQPSVAQNPMPCSSASPATVSTTTMLPEGKRSADHNPMHSTPPDCDPSLHAINRHNQQYHPPPPPPTHANTSGLPQVVSSQTFLQGMDDTCHFDDDHPDNVGSTTMIRFGAATGDVSLTLGLRHAGNTPDQKSSPFSVRDFGNC